MGFLRGWKLWDLGKFGGYGIELENGLDIRFLGCFGRQGWDGILWILGGFYEDLIGVFCNIVLLQ